MEGGDKSNCHYYVWDGMNKSEELAQPSNQWFGLFLSLPTVFIILLLTL